MTIITINIHTYIANKCNNSVFDWHWSWKLYPSKNIKYFVNKYGSISNAMTYVLIK